MTERDYTDYIRDILSSIQDVEEFTSEITFEDFLQDKKTFKAVIRSLEVLGEASKKIPEKVKTRYPRIPVSPGKGWRG
jgi:uncharacterized protein with HEPN domain